MSHLPYWADRILLFFAAAAVFMIPAVLTPKESQCPKS
jgi:hypothetical protein